MGLSAGFLTGLVESLKPAQEAMLKLQTEKMQRMQKLQETQALMDKFGITGAMKTLNTPFDPQQAENQIEQNARPGTNTNMDQAMLGKGSEYQQKLDQAKNVLMVSNMMGTKFGGGEMSAEPHMPDMMTQLLMKQLGGNGFNIGNNFDPNQDNTPSKIFSNGTQDNLSGNNNSGLKLSGITYSGGRANPVFGKDEQLITRNPITNEYITRDKNGNRVVMNSVPAGSKASVKDMSLPSGFMDFLSNSGKSNPKAGSLVQPTQKLKYLGQRNK